MVNWSFGYTSKGIVLFWSAFLFEEVVWSFPFIPQVENSTFPFPQKIMNMNSS